MDCTLHHHLPVSRSKSYRHNLSQRLLLGAFTLSSLIGQGYHAQPSSAQPADYCHIPAVEVNAKNVLRLAANKAAVIAN
jgi:hypothetical protein